MSSVPSTYSIKTFPPLKISDPAAAVDVAKSVLVFIYKIKPGKFFESWCNKHMRIHCESYQME
ncbi:unnamed protein product [Hymenolepis diminuta]|uniref:Uncharacterized protein n=1 Tax=Hymenolepis diminuta TaxID=6216 RepID=A0A564ZDN6_HYMDI|nr:unnamed protein product [Hymenolepis diminuta]